MGFNRGITDPRQKVVFHTLRHSYASWLAEAGTDIYTVGKLLGHSTVQMSALCSPGTWGNARGRQAVAEPDHRGPGRAGEGCQNPMKSEKNQFDNG